MKAGTLNAQLNDGAADSIRPFRIAGDAPIGFAVFEADPIVRLLLDPDRRIGHWSEFDRGGHFPSMEVPDLLAQDLFTFFRPLR